MYLKKILFFIFYFSTFLCISQNKEIILKINSLNNQVIDEVNIITVLDNLLIEQNTTTGFYHINGINDSINSLNIYLYKDNYTPINEIVLLQKPLNVFEFKMDENTILNDIIIDYAKPIVESNKITYRVNSKFLLENSNVHDALKLIPFVFQRIENNTTTYRYKNKEVFLFINGSIENNNIVIPDAALIEKIEFYPYGNSSLKEGGLPLINIILKKRELTNKSTVFIKTSPLLNDNLLNYDFLYSNKKISLSLPFTIFQSKYTSHLKTENNYDINSNYKLIQSMEDLNSSIKPTLNIKFNKANSLISTAYLGVSSKDNYQEKSYVDALFFDSKIKNKKQDVFISTTYEHKKENTVFSIRGFSRYTFNDFKWNNDIKNSSEKKYYLGDLNIRRSDLKWYKYTMDYKVGYSLIYTDNLIKGSTSNYTLLNSTNVFYAGSVVNLNHNISIDTYLSYNLIHRGDYKKNFFIPNLSINYKTDQEHLFSLSFRDEYMLPNERFTNENIDYTPNNNQVLGSRYLEGYNKTNFAFTFTSNMYDIDYSLSAAYEIPNNEIIGVPSIHDDSLLFEFKNSGSKFHKINFGIDLSKSFLKDKLFVQFETFLHLNKSDYLINENNLTRINHLYFSYNLYLKLLLDTKSSLELISYWDSNRIELFSSHSSNYPMVSLSYTKNISKNMSLKLEAYSPLISDKEKNYINRFYQTIKRTSYDFNDLKFISIQLRYNLGNSKIRNVKSSSNATMYES